MNDLKYKRHPLFSNYEITSNGKVWSIPRTGKGGHSGKWMKTHILPNGYEHIICRRNAKPYNKYIHHLVLETFVGSRPQDKECRHIDGNRLNNCIENLCWDTRTINANDKNFHGTMRCGENHEWSKLTKADVIHIFQLRNRGLTHKAISKYFNVQRECITKILNHKRWKQKCLD